MLHKIFLWIFFLKKVDTQTLENASIIFFRYKWGVLGEKPILSTQDNYQKFYKDMYQEKCNQNFGSSLIFLFT